MSEVGIYLDHAGAAPVSSRVDETVRQFVDAASRRDGYAYDARVSKQTEGVRGRVAALLSAEPSEIAFVSHAEQGLERVADDVDWRRGDVIVAVGGIAPAPFARLAERGVAIHSVPLEKGVLCPERLDAALRHPRVRLLMLSAVDATSGARLPLADLGRVCRERGVLCCVDASQQLGCLELDVAACGIDYLVSDAHRFLLGLAGTGLVFRNRRSAPDTTPAGCAFESGPTNALGIAALGAAVDLLLELGIPAIEGRVLELTDRLHRGLEARGITSAAPREGLGSNIVCFRIDGEPPARTAERLLARRIWVATTSAGVRVSPHGYIEPSDIDALLDVL